MNDDTAPSGNASPSAEMAEKLGLNKAQQSFVNRYKWYIAIVALVVFGSIGLN